MSICLQTKWNCSHLNFRYRTCFQQRVPWHSSNYRVWIHSKTRTWLDKNMQSRQHFFEALSLSFKSFSFFFNFSKFACHVLIPFWSFFVIWLSSFFLYKTTRLSFSTLTCLFISSWFEVSYVNGAGASFDFRSSFSSSPVDIYSAWWGRLGQIGGGGEGGWWRGHNCLELLRNCQLNLKIH